MNLTIQRQDLQKLLNTKIDEYYKHKILDINHRENTLKHIYKMMITDPELQELFKLLIKMEVKKLKYAQAQDKYSPQKETKLIKENIKAYVQFLIIKKYWQKQPKPKNQNKSFHFQTKSSTGEKTENIINTQQKSQMENKFQTRLIIPAKFQNEAKREDILKYNKRKIIKKQKLKETHQMNKSEQIIQITSQSQDQPQQKCMNSYKKYCDGVEKQKTPTKKLSFLSSKMEESRSQLQKTAQIGHFILGDNVKNVLDIYYLGEQEKDSVVLIQWKERRDGFKPQYSMISLKEYQQYKPLQVRLLLRKMETTG